MATPIPTNRARFTLNAILTATRGRLAGALDDAALEVVGVSTDSRAVGRGEVFVALSGERFDGHDHLAAVAERGAALAIVERDVRVPGLTTLRVESTLEALGRLAAAHVARWRANGSRKVIALTGSAGKTTTKRALAALAEARLPGRVLATAGNLNNLVGVPMTLLTLSEEHELAILEMGTNSPGEIGRLVRMARPDVGLVTLIASAHSEGLGGLDGIAREKTAMFRDLNDDALAVGNADDARVALGLSASSAREHVGYGTCSDADYRIVRRETLGLEQQRIDVRRPDGSNLEVVTPLLGEAGSYATVAALATVETLFVGRPFSRDELLSALAPLGELDEGPGRMQRRELESGVLVLDDSYNANPASCRASIGSARELALATGRALVLVLGEMRELGADRESAHLALGDWAVESGARLLVTVGREAERACLRARERGLESVHAGTADAAASLACQHVRGTDLVLVKGSRGVRTELVIAALAAVPVGTERSSSEGVHA